MSRKDQSFKAEAVRLALTGDKTIAQTARDLGVNESTLYNWISKTKRSGSRPSGVTLGTPNLVDELNRLRKENARLKEEREILKKAAAFFAKESR